MDENNKTSKKILSEIEKEKILEILKNRMENNNYLDIKLDWEQIINKLISEPNKLWSINQMEITGGEPSIIGIDENTKEYIFCDTSRESPEGRRSLCYDRKALDERKKNKPENSIMDLAKSMDIEVLDEEDYRKLQKLGEFDTKTSSWIKTPEEVRKLGGALFCDRRYNRVFTYHNGADSYYGARGFRGKIRV